MVQEFQLYLSILIVGTPSARGEAKLHLWGPTIFSRGPTWVQVKKRKPHKDLQKLRENDTIAQPEMNLAFSIHIVGP